MSSPASSESRANALQCRGLVKHYGDVVAVDGLDLAVARGECLGLLGPNGAGKTTTVEIFEGLTAPTSGTVELLGETWGGRENQARDNPGLRARLGIQLQETKFPEKLKVKEIVTLFRSFYRQGLTSDQALDLVDLVEKSDAQVRTLSGGQKQRLSLACAVVGDPEVLFLDEPTTGLDPASRRQIWKIVEGFKSRGRTVLLTTHYMEEAARLSDRVAIVDRGRLLAEGTPDSLIATLGAEHVVEVETEPPVAAEDLAGLDGVVEVAESGTALRLTVTAVHVAVPALLAWLAETGRVPSRLATHHATLEDVFLAHTGRTLEGPADARSEGA